MKIEVNYGAHPKSRLSGKVEVTLNECQPADLVPAFRITDGLYNTVIYGYNGKLWRMHGRCVMFVYELSHATLREMPPCEPIDDEWMSMYLSDGSHIFRRVEEPFYYLCVGATSPEGMVRVSCRPLPGKRRYAPHERERALECAQQIFSMIYTSNEAFSNRARPGEIIEVLKPDGAAKTPLNRRHFQCNHCLAVKFADEAILLDHLSNCHPEILDDACYPDETTAGDVIYPNYTEVIWAEDIRRSNAESSAEQTAN